MYLSSEGEPTVMRTLHPGTHVIAVFENALMYNPRPHALKLNSIKSHSNLKIFSSDDLRGLWKKKGASPVQFKNNGIVFHLVAPLRDTLVCCCNNEVSVKDGWVSMYFHCGAMLNDHTS